MEDSVATLARHHEALVGLTRNRVWLAGSEGEALGEITAGIARALEAERASFWSFTPDRMSIECRNLYEASMDRHSAGILLAKEDYPAYFRAMEESEVIAAHDARTDPRTAEFTADYLEPNGITSMLDVPVLLGGELAGVLCLEHVGPARHWDFGERSLAIAVASLVSILLARTAQQQSDAERSELVHSLRERIKELRALHAITDVLRNTDAQVPWLLREVVNLIPPAMQHPELAVARVTLGGEEHASNDVRPLQGGVEEKFTLACGETGSLAVGYVANPSPSAVEPFLPEERNLIATLADVLRTDLNRRITESDLRASEERFREVVDNMGDVFFNLDVVNNRLLYANRVYETIWQRPLAHVLENPLAYLDGVHPEDRPGAADAFEKQLKGMPTDTEFRVIQPDGAIRWVRERAVPIVDDHGQVTRVVGTMRDITERKEALDQVRASEERFRLLARATTDAIWDWDLRSRQLWWNEGFRVLFGHGPAGPGATIEDLMRHIHPDDIREVTTSIQRAIDNGESSWEGEFRFRRSDDSYANVMDRRHILRDASGQVVRLIGGMIDLTEKKRMDQHLQRAQRMESIGTLAGGIAHDLNNLLAPITLSVDLIRQLHDDPDTRQIVDVIERSASRGADLVKQVLSFARGTEGAKVAVSIATVIREVQSIMASTFPKNIQIVSRIPESLWPVLGDPTQLTQVLLNLCVNARDAMPEGGQISIEVSNRKFTAEEVLLHGGRRHGRHLQVEVADTGCGISREDLPRVFDPFFTTKDSSRGTGLGLSTVMGIVRGHDGFISIYSEEGLGTCLRVALPAMDGPDAAADEDSTDVASLPRGNGEVVLVVDDEETILNVAKQTLEAFGYRVLTAADGAQAVEVYNRHRSEIAVVLTDMMMPVMDGPALIRALNQMNPEVRIVGSSGLNANGRVAAARREGVVRYIAKPYTVQSLLTELAAALQD